MEKEQVKKELQKSIKSLESVIDSLLSTIGKNVSILLIINPEKKVVALKHSIDGKEIQYTKVNCHELDKFDWKIGFGLCVSKVYGNNAKWRRIRNYLRDSKNKLKYKEYANWCITEQFSNDIEMISIFKKNVNNLLKKNGTIAVELKDLFKEEK